MNLNFLRIFSEGFQYPCHSSFQLLAIFTCFKRCKSVVCLCQIDSHLQLNCQFSIAQHKYSCFSFTEMKGEKRRDVFRLFIEWHLVQKLLCKTFCSRKLTAITIILSVSGFRILNSLAENSEFRAEHSENSVSEIFFCQCQLSNLQRLRFLFECNYYRQSLAAFKMAKRYQKVERSNNYAALSVCRAVCHNLTT